MSLWIIENDFEDLLGRAGKSCTAVFGKLAYFEKTWIFIYE